MDWRKKAHGSADSHVRAIMSYEKVDDREEIQNTRTRWSALRYSQFNVTSAVAAERGSARS